MLKKRDLRPRRWVWQTVIVGLFVIVVLGCSRKDESAAFVEDQAGLLDQQQKERIAAYHKALLEALDVHFRVTILNTSPQSLDREAVELFGEYALGDQTRGARGLLFLVDPAGSQVRLEVGYDLEGIFPDGFVAYVEHEQMAPFFRAGRVGAGIEATGELLVARALNLEGEDSTETPNSAVAGGHLTGGAGARIGVEIGAGADSSAVPEKSLSEERFGPGATPLQALETYMMVLQQKVKDPNLGLFTPESRAFFSQWLVTDAQQNHELQDLECRLSQAQVQQKGDRAVVIFPIDKRQASPYLMRRSEAGWAFDFAAMSQLIGFNHKNQWFFRRLDHEFMFAFSDVRFDKHGFPHN